MNKIRIAIAGLGNCASSLLQGIEYYRQIPEDGADSSGLMHYALGPYRPFDIELVAAFDIDQRKVGKAAAEAIFAPPNNTKVFYNKFSYKGVPVVMGNVLDGISEHMNDYPESQRFVASDRPCASAAYIESLLKDTGAEILMNEPSV
jgi:myo-inositol-1-phosphate synthase